MSGEETTDLPIGEALLAAGWTQGAIFSAPGAMVYYNDQDKADTTLTTLGAHKIKAKYKLVIATQDCDILSPLEPFVEALVCHNRGQDYITRVDYTSARWFVISPELGLVTEAHERVLISKEKLLNLTPEPWPSSKARYKEYIKYLGRRFDRVPVPNVLVDAFDRPVSEFFKRLREANSNDLKLFNRVIREIRVTPPDTTTPPFNISAVLISKRQISDPLSKREDNAITRVYNLLLQELDTAKVSLDPNLRMVTTDEFTLREYEDTRALFLDYFSQGATRPIGAHPVPRL